MKTHSSIKTHLMKTLLYMLLSAFVLGISACNPKEDKAKYHGEIKAVIDKAERNAEFVSKLMSSDSADSESIATQINNLQVSVEGLNKFENDLRSAKTELAQVSTPKFDEFNLKASTDKWFDAQIKGTSDMKVIFAELLAVLKSIDEIQKAEANDEEVSDERKTQALGSLQAINVDKRFRDIETAMHNAKNEVLTNEEKFILQNSLKVTKFVVGNL